MGDEDQLICVKCIHYDNRDEQGFCRVGMAIYGLSNESMPCGCKCEFPAPELKPGEAVEGVPKLKPCPFCGAVAYYTRAVNGTEVHRVGCSFCGIVFKAMEVHYPDPSKDHLTKDIVAAWNARADLTHSVLAAEIQRLAPSIPQDSDVQTALAELREMFPLSSQIHVSHRQQWGDEPSDRWGAQVNALFTGGTMLAEAMAKVREWKAETK